MRRPISYGKRRRLLVGASIGYLDQTCGVYHAQLGRAAVEHFAHQPFFGRDRVQWVYQNPVADRPAIDAGADFSDLAGNIKTDNDR